MNYPSYEDHARHAENIQRTFEVALTKLAAAEKFEDDLRALAARNPSISLSAALRWVASTKDAGVDWMPDPSDSREEWAEFVYDNAMLMGLMRDSKKINAIKELRGLGGIGLKEAKDAVELAWSWEGTGRLTRSEILVSAEETQAAIDSIMKAGK